MLTGPSDLKKSLTRSVVLFLVLLGCSTALTKEGSNIQVVTEREREAKQCRLIKIVTASHGTGASTEDDLDSVMNSLRNKAAASGGNAIRLLQQHTNGDMWQGGESSGIAEVLHCSLPDKCHVPHNRLQAAPR